MTKNDGTGIDPARSPKADECRHLAILAADIVGYTRMMAEDHKRTLERLRALRDTVVEPTIARHRGTVVKRLGDGWLATFERSDDALASAIAIQDGLDGDGHRLRIGVQLRIGIHVGAVSLVDEDVFGTGVNIAARLEALAHGGGIIVSDAAMSGIAPGVRAAFEDAGPRSLKNVSEPVRIWARGGLPALPDAPRDADAAIMVEPLVLHGSREQEDVARDLAAALETELARYRWLSVIADDQAAGRPDGGAASLPCRGHLPECRPARAGVGASSCLPRW